MIEVSWSGLFLAYLLLLMGGVSTLWFLTHLAQKKKKVLLFEEITVICEYCLTTFAAKKTDPLCRCPSCQCLNKKLV